MTQENKELLLKDLCSRIRYGVICSVTHKKNGELVKEDMKLSGIFEDGNFYFLNEKGSTYSDNYIPYLRPISNMTEEEENEYNILNVYEKGCFHTLRKHLIGLMLVILIIEVLLN